MSELTAIDILINPDEATIEHARKVNAQMRQSVPDGYAIDATHQPHITTLQRYIRSADLNGVFEAVYHLGNSGTARTQLKAWPLTK